MGTLLMLFVFFTAVSLVYSLFIDSIWKENQINPQRREDPSQPEARSRGRLILFWISSIIRLLFMRTTAG
ncbi:MAG: hypothetical protein GX495_20305 [Chloroflexi bacterium]|jgi:hypothetical protein|nr:hypothetical protein [Chloroflexota bacterium]